jgi:transcriptional regulator with XRE-family HTH domain
MKLGEWLSSKGLSQQAFADGAGISQGAVAKFVLGQRIPHKLTMRKIFVATDGQVTANDFHGQHQDAACQAASL